MKAWYAQVMHDARHSKVPTLFLRYEDLTVDAKPGLTQTMRLLLQLDDLGGRYAEQRIEEVLGASEGKTVSYKLKQDPKVCYQSASMYTQA